MPAVELATADPPTETAAGELSPSPLHHHRDFLRAAAASQAGTLAKRGRERGGQHAAWGPAGGQDGDPGGGQKQNSKEKEVFKGKVSRDF